MDHANRFPRTLVGFGLTWHGGKSTFMIFGNIGNSLHHRIPPNLSSCLQISPRIFLKAKVPSQELSNHFLSSKNDKKNSYFSNKCHSLGVPSFFVEMATLVHAFLRFFL